MRRFWILFWLGLALPTFAEDIYVAQTSAGGDTGVDASNAHSAAWFNTTTNWAAGTDKVSPGDTVHLCGTITSALTAQGSGTVGSIITIRFESGCVLTSPGGWGIWANTTGAISLSGLSYVSIDGGSNGQINCSANGTGLANHDYSCAVAVKDCTNIHVGNLFITNIYVNQGYTAAATDIDGYGSAGIRIAGASSYIHIYSNNIGMTGWPITCMASAGYDHYEIDHNKTVNAHWHIFWGMSAASAVNDIKIHDNDISDWTAWGWPSDTYHQDGIFCWTENGGTLGIEIYNNYIHGPFGTPGSWTGLISLTYGSVTGAYNAVVHNNLCVSTNGLASLWTYPSGVTGSIVWANNTLVNGYGASSVLAASRYTNNIFYNCESGAFAGGSPANSDYNVFYNTTGSTATDTHSVTTDPKLDASYKLQSGSSAIGIGANLTSLFTVDKDGVVYPEIGAWDIGPFQYVAPVGTNAVLQYHLEGITGGGFSL